jgi:hypothetical protein
MIEWQLIPEPVEGSSWYCGKYYRLGFVECKIEFMLVSLSYDFHVRLSDFINLHSSRSPLGMRFLSVGRAVVPIHEEG